MNSRIEIFGALENAIHALLAVAATERERALQAVCEIQHLKKADFSGRVESADFEQINAFNKELKAGTISDDHLRRLRAHFWELYKSVEKSLRQSD